MSKKRLIKIISLCLTVVLFLSSVGFLLFDNFGVESQQIHIFNDKIPESFHNYLIAHVSDYHNRTSSLVDKQIIESLKEWQPDIIVITGDHIDSTYPDVDVALDFTQKLCEIAPVYYVTGNHESNVKRSDEAEFNRLMTGLEDLGVTLLRNKSVKIENEAGDYFYLHGIDDPYFYGGYEQDFQRTEILCRHLNINDEELNVLLTHHPETLSVYYKYNFDLVFSGHAHGGQITLFGKAIMAPDQVYFPPYDEGLYKMVDTQMVLSRGIGYSTFPLRVMCSPHLIYAEFKAHK